jgi:single-strand DNA-binding protein
MASYNKIILMGNLTRDPEMRESQRGTSFVKTAIAVNDRVPNSQGGWDDKATFFELVIFGKRAEAFEKYLRKGSSVLVDGKLEVQKWKDKEGLERTTLSVNVNDWQFAGGKADNAGGGHSAPSEQDPQQSSAAAPVFPGPASFGGGMSDDVPF